MGPLLTGILLFTLAQVTTWFQINGQFVWPILQKYPIIISITGVPVTYLLIQATKFAVRGFDGQLWPSRFLGFGVGIIVYAIMVQIFFSEGFSVKTIVSLLLATVLMLIQVFWR